MTNQKVGEYGPEKLRIWTLFTQCSIQERDLPSTHLPIGSLTSVFFGMIHQVQFDRKSHQNQYRQWFEIL